MVKGIIKKRKKTCLVYVCVSWVQLFRVKFDKDGKKNKENWRQGCKFVQNLMQTHAKNVKMYIEEREREREKERKGIGNYCRESSCVRLKCKLEKLAKVKTSQFRLFFT